MLSQQANVTVSRANVKVAHTTVCCCVLLCVAVCCCVLLCVAVCCCVLQCVAVCCSVLQRVAVCSIVLRANVTMAHTALGGH